MLLLSRFDVHNVISVLRAQASADSRPSARRSRSRPWAGWSNRSPARSCARASSRARSTCSPAPRRTTSRPTRCAPPSASTSAPRISRRSSGRSSPTTRRAPPPRSALPAGTASALLRFTRARDRRAATSSSRFACAMRWPRRRRPPDTLLAGGSVPPRVRDRGPRPRARRGRRGARATSAGRRGARRSRGGRRRGDLTALERELERQPDRGRHRAVRRRRPARDRRSARLHGCEAQRRPRNLRLLGEAAARGIAPDTVRRELLWPGVRA